MTAFMQNWLAGEQAGRLKRFEDEALGKQNRLAELAGDAFSAPLEQRGDYIAQMARLDPEKAARFGSMFDGQAKTQQEADMGRARSQLALAMRGQGPVREQAYTQLKGFVANRFGTQLPDMADDNTLAAINSALGGGDAQGAMSPRMMAIQKAYSDGLLTPERYKEAIEIELDLRPGAQNQRWNWRDTELDDGTIRRDGLPVISGNVVGGGPSQAPQPSQTPPPQMGGVNVPTMFAATFPGAQITSGIRGPERNAAVGGVPNSLHMKGDAVDIRPRDAEEQQQMLAFARQNGLQVKTYPDGRLHIERDGAPANRPDFAPYLTGGAPAPAVNPDAVNRLLDAQTYPGGVSPFPSITSPGQATNESRAKAKANEAGLVREQEDLTRMGTERLGQIRGAARLANSEMASLDVLEQQLSKVDTGAFAQTRIGLGKTAAFLGFSDGEEVSAAEAAQSIANRLALQLRNPQGGEGMPGAMSDADREFLISTIPSIANTPNGWKTMIEIRRRLAKSSQDQAIEAQRFMDAGGRARDLEGHMMKWANERPVLSDFAGQGGGQGEQQRPAGIPEGARQAPDGNFYVQQGGRWFRVEQ